ncbi:MAG: VTT domain-containing protein [Ruminococcus sp.]|nr:VTT domain-containing protein [Ruminococcus sp.]MCM1382772.1 VTT domain-containing protein [Muribaculaceae bacterium]
MRKFKGTAVIKTVMQFAPILMIIVCVVIYFRFFRGVTIEKILEFTPDNLWLAALVMVGLFGMKSLSFFFPMLVLVAASGSIFPNYFAALTVNSIGVLLMLTLPYLIGRFAEREFVRKIISKRKNADKLREFKSENELFIAFFLRVINILPCDVVSLFLGSADFSPFKYIVGSFLGIFPGLVTTTLMGANVEHPTSPAFWIAAVVEVVFAAGSAAAYWFYKKRHKKS